MGIRRGCNGRALAVVGLAAALMGAASPPPLAADAGGDASFLLQTRVAPNVVLIFDNSLSMNHVVWHPAFRIDFVYDTTTCPYGSAANCLQYPLCDIDSGDTILSGAGGSGSWPLHGEGYQTTAGGTASLCSNSREVFSDPEVQLDGNGTIWNEKYLEWYFSDNVEIDHDGNGLTIQQEIVATGNGATSQCLVGEGAAATYDRYRRSRVTAAKNVLRQVICETSAVADIRYGLGKFYLRPGFFGLPSDPDGGWVNVPVADYSQTQADALEDAIDVVEGESTTPLAETLYNVYRYFMLRGTDEQPYGKNGSTRFPAYDLIALDGSVLAASAPASPVTSACQKHFVVYLTDGEPSYDDFDDETTPDKLKPGKTAWRDQLIGDYYLPGDETEELGGLREEARYLDDVAHFMHTQDFLPTAAYPGSQTLDVYTIGFTTNAVANDILSRAAQRGGGEFYTSNNPEELTEAITGAISSIVTKAQSFTSAAVPATRTTSGADFYQGYFYPSSSSAFWEGHIRAWHIEPNGDLTDANGDCALDDPTVAECNSGSFLTDAVPFWDAFDEVPLPADRDLYTSKLVSGTPDRVAFDSALTAADLGLQAFSSPPDPAPNDPGYPGQGSRAQNAEGLADEVVAHGRGCFFGTGVQTADVSGGLACVARAARLGDVFHSNPIVVTRPSGRFDASYQAFKTHYASRSRVLYAGTNGGFLEAVHAGDWATSPAPAHYDDGTGAELFGFMPWESRLKIKNQIVDPPSLRTYYVDGDAQVADVWIYPSDDETAKAADGSEWRTILVGGLREGGREYYALDITNPDGIAGPDATTLDYPGYLWEFPREDDPDGDLAWMGETFGQPILTRIRVQNQGDPDPKPVYERWVAIVTAGYAETGDPNPPSVRGTTGVTWDYHEGGGRGLFVIDVTTGEVLAEKKFVDDTGSACPSGSTDLQQELCYAIVSTPAVFDLDSDGFADLIYVGDIAGNVWKWLIHAVGEDRVNDGSGERTQPNWPFKKFFDAPEVSLTVSGETHDYHQNFYFAPSGAKVGSKLWLAFGSGERRNIGFEGVTSSTGENNRFYVVRDPDPWELSPTPFPVIMEGDGPDTGTVADLVDATASPGGVSVPSSQYGYFVRGVDGEKFLTRTEIFGGYVITASFTPEDTGDPCTSRGNGKAYVFDLESGAGYFRDVSGNPTRGLDLGTGLPAGPKTSVGVLGKQNRVYIEKSGADLESFEAVDIRPGGWTLYWREVP